MANKTFFAPHGSDGMTIDNKGNVYLTSGKIWIYNPKGELIEEIECPEKPSNDCFCGKKRNILFITARKSVYTEGNQVKIGEHKLPVSLSYKDELLKKLGL